MIALLPLAACWCAGAVLLLLDGRRRAIAIGAAVVLGLVFACDLALLAAQVASDAPAAEIITGGWPAGVGIRLRVDRLALFFGAICSAVLAAVMTEEARATVRERLLPALLLLLCAGLHGAFFTGDLFNFYVFFELAVVASFVLAAYGYGRAELRGALVYIVVNLLGSVAFLIGVAAVYHSAGTLDLAQIMATTEARADPLLVPAALLFSGMVLKLGLFPLHVWVPVLYSHARPLVAAALAGALVNIGIYGLLRLGFATLPDARREASFVLVGLGVASTLYGSILAVNRRTPAQIAAYLSVAQAGYVVLGVGVGGRAGIAVALLAALAGSLEKAAMFLSLGASGWARSAVAFSAAASLTGMPLTVGFVSKVALFRASVHAPAGGIVIGVVVAASLLALVASFRFWRATADSGTRRESTSVALALALLIVALGTLPQGAAILAEQLASALLGARG